MTHGFDGWVVQKSKRAVRCECGWVSTFRWKKGSALKLIEELRRHVRSSWREGTMTDELWQIVDRRTARPVTIMAYTSKESAETQIRAWEERAARGDRPDTAHLVGHMEARKIIKREEDV